MADPNDVTVQGREIQRELVHFGRKLHRLGFAPGTSGNLSIRLNEAIIVCTPTGMSKERIRLTDMVFVDMSGNPVVGTRQPTSEIDMHLAIYRWRRDTAAVVHAHPPIATGFASAGLGLDERLCSETIMTLGSIPLAPYATPGTPAVAQSLVPFMSEYEAVMMSNHGVVTWGVDLEEAFMRMEIVEHSAQIALIVRHLGGGRTLSSENVEELLSARTRYRANSASTIRNACISSV
jgi:L-fuculose-phosphate aldolase